MPNYRGRDYSEYRSDLPGTGYEDECYVCGKQLTRGDDETTKAWCVFTWNEGWDHRYTWWGRGLDPHDMTLCARAECHRLAPVLMRRARRLAREAART